MSMQEEFSVPAQAIGLVTAYVDNRLEVTDEKPDYDAYVVWCVKVLQNWKALVSTSLPDGMYYEVTFNGDKNEAYIDAYKKFENILINMDDFDV